MNKYTLPIEIDQNEMQPIVYQKKLFGILKDALVVSEDFFEPLPEDVVDSFYE